MSPSALPDPGAIVLGANRRSLSVVRSLGRRGIQTWVMPTDGQLIAARSRYASRILPAPSDPDMIGAALLAAAHRYGLDGWVLIATDDDDVGRLLRHHAMLARHFRIATAPGEIPAWALDKARAYAFASELRVAVPRTRSITGADALADPGLPFPLIVKPSFRPREIAHAIPKAWRADDPAELARAYAAAAEWLAPGQLMLQELIPGDGECQLAYTALCRDGVVLVSLAARRLRQWPVDFGAASSYVESIAEGDLAAPSERLLAATGYTGIVELEYKRDRRDGRLVLLDVNPRPWGWLSLAPAAGVDFAYLLHRMLTGADVPRLRGVPGVRWMRAATDVPAALALARRGELSARAYLRSLRPPVAWAILAADDPVPALADLPLAGYLALRRRRSARTGTPSAVAPGGREPRQLTRPRGDEDTAARPRVLIVVENQSVPGDRRVELEAHTLARAGWEVTILSPRDRDDDRPSDDTLDGITIRRFAITPAERSRLGHWREYGGATWRIWREVRRLAAERPFDVIHGCNPPDHLLLTALGQRRRGTRLIFDHHDLSAEMYAARSDGGRPAIRRALLMVERLGVRVADAVLATNGSVADVLVGRDGVRPEDVFVVRNGPELASFTPVAPAPALRRGQDHLLVYVGVMGPQDGIDHAVHALAHLHGRRHDWHALFIGDGESLAGLRALTHELGLDSCVEFVGHQEELAVRTAICSADVCLAPDPRDPYTDRSTLVKLAEYMVLSRPTVSYGLTESRVTAGDAAIYARDNDPEDFARCIEALLDDPRRRERLGREGRVRVERGLSWEHAEPVLLAAYAHALGAGPLAPSEREPSVLAARSAS